MIATELLVQMLGPADKHSSVYIALCTRSIFLSPQNVVKLAVQNRNEVWCDVG